MIIFQIFIFVAYFGRLFNVQALPVPFQIPNSNSKHGLGERAERLSGSSLDTIGLVGGNVIVSNVIGSIHENQKNGKGAWGISSEEEHELSRKIEKLFSKEVSSSHSHSSSSEERGKLMMPNVIHHLSSPKSASISHQGIKNSHYNSKNKYHIFHLYPQDKNKDSSSRSYENFSRSKSSESYESRDSDKLQKNLSKRIQKYIKSKQYEDRSKSREKYSSESRSRERSRKPEKNRRRHNSRD